MEGLGKVEPTTYMNELPVTIEEEKQMDTIITGVSGNQYQQIKFHETPPQPTLTELFNTLATTLQQLGSHIESLYHQSSQPTQTDLAQTVDTVLENADWLYAKLGDAMDKKYDIPDLVIEGVSDKVEREVSDFFGHNFSLEDYVDMHDLVSDAVADRIDEAVQDAIEEAVSNIIKSATIKVEF